MFCYLFLILSFITSDVFPAPLSPESTAYLRASGELPAVAERFVQAVSKGVESPGSNILDNLHRAHRDNPDETVLRLPVILVDFSDNIANRNLHNQAYYNQLLFSIDAFETGSVREYFRENSYGEVDIQGVVAGWVRVAQNYGYYVNRMNGLGNYPMNSQGLTREAALLANNSLNYAQFDNDGDGVVDALVIIHAGPGAEARNGNIDMIWSHAWGLNENWLRLDGVFLNQFVVLPEDGNIGIFCHEFGHALFGLPDLYDRNYESMGLGVWSVMSFGCWNGNRGDSPAHFDAWCKKRMRFVSVENLEHNRFNLEIPPVENDPSIYRLWTEGEREREYFLVENRQQLGFDAALPNSGLLIYHIDDSVLTQNDRPFWPGHQNRGHYLAALEQADGNWDLEQNENRGDAGDPYPGSSGNELFNLESAPASRSYADENTQVEVRFIRAQDHIITVNLKVNERPPVLEVAREEVNVSYNKGFRYFEVVNLANQGEEMLRCQAELEILTEFQREWISLRPDSAWLAPQSDWDLILAFSIWQDMDEAEYNAELHIFSNDPDAAEVVVPVHLNVIDRVFSPLEHFTDFNWTETAHLIELSSVLVDDEVAPAGLEIGVWTPNQTLAGGTVWDPEERVFIDAWGDDPQTEEVDGFVQGDRMSFSIWDGEADLEYITWSNWIDGPETWQDDGLSTVELQAFRPYTFILPVHQNWNIISTPVPPPDRDMLQIWQPVVQRGNLLLVKDHFGRFYVPEFGYNGLVEGWDPLYGYQVRMANSDTLDFRGEPLPGWTPIPLREGWTMASYLPDFTQSAPAALADIRGVLIIAKDEIGRFYSPAHNFNNLNNMRRGLGYLIKVSQEIDLVWNTDRQRAAVVEAHPGGEETCALNRLHHFPRIQPTDRNQSLLLKAEAAMSGCEAAAISDRGEVFGVTLLDLKGEGGMAVWGDDPTTEMRDGFKEGEHFNILLWFKEIDIELKVFSKTFHNSEAFTYKTDDFSVVKLELCQLIPTQLQLGAFPNPFNVQTSINYYLPEEANISLKVVDIKGREVSVLKSGRHQAGRHNVVWEIHDEPSGLYFITLTGDEITRCRKVILLK